MNNPSLTVQTDVINKAGVENLGGREGKCPCTLQSGRESSSTFNYV